MAFQLIYNDVIILQSDLWIVQSNVPWEGIYMCYFDIFHVDRHINDKKKQTENFFMLDTIIPKACKKRPEQEMGKN